MKRYTRDQLASMRVALSMEHDAALEQAKAFEKKTGVPSLFYTEQHEALGMCLDVIRGLDSIDFRPITDLD